MTVEIRKAERTKAKLRLGIAGPSGAGKTMSSLKLAKGITPTGRILMIDTERGSGDLYADLFDYDIITLQPPYKPEKYVEAIRAAEEAGYDTVIIDSLSHAWSDEGGILDQADKLSAGGNRFTVWAKLTPQHRALVNAMLNSPAHVIATVRSKQDYAIDDNDKGRKTVKKLGLAPVQREGMEYEFTVFLDVDQDHNARASKDRTNLFKDEVFVIDEKIGRRILEWLNSGKEAAPEDINLKKAKIVHCLRLLGADVATQEAIRKSIIGLTQLDGARVENADAILMRLEEKVKAMPPAKPAAPAPASVAPKAADPAAGDLSAEEEAAALAAMDAARAEAENHG
ncbi:ATP-binding protein [Nitrobacter sp. TKz-YC02]|uniref:ATP-binding protein n=1 Tax=Nitrobacter sp. TKz-YC02 TaxID=3398704 RepID=UPI003CF25035